MHKRYQSSGEVPDVHGNFDSPFTIGGRFKDGRAAYLDNLATTRLDLRVLDAIMKVKRKYLLFLLQVAGNLMLSYPQDRLQCQQ